jgi:hypothetical protein
LLHVQVLRARTEAGRFLEQGVLADIKGEPASDLLGKALGKLRESRKYMDELHAKIGEMRRIEQNNAVLPEHNVAFHRILLNHPPVERVSLTNSRFANVSQAKGVAITYGPIGNTYDELLANLQSDLEILQKEHDQTIEAFEAILPAAGKGGFAAIVLSGRAPLPERIMHSADQMMVYVQFFNRACMTTISADMQVYPKGLEWLPKAGWRDGRPPEKEQDKKLEDRRKGAAASPSSGPPGLQAVTQGNALPRETGGSRSVARTGVLLISILAVAGVGLGGSFLVRRARQSGANAGERQPQ